jgi:Xaa-Pro aminopeptidase
MSHAPTAALSARHNSIRQALAAQDLDVLVVTSLPNVLYLTNFTGSAAIVLLTGDRLIFVTDFRYVTTMAEAMDTPNRCPDLELVKVEGAYDTTLAGLLGSMAGKRVGFEAAHLTVSRLNYLSKILGSSAGNPPQLVATEGIVEASRAVKDAFEIATLRDAARRLSAVARELPTEIRRGRTEREIARSIEQRLHDAGFTKPAFDTIVASGPNAALPHSKPGERRLSEGDLVVLDFGGVYDSYCVDLTRTVAVGTAGQRAREVYEAVLEAHDQAVAHVAPGRSRFAIDAAARETLTRYGLAEAFGHGTGHGLGIEVHEDPRITRPRAGEEQTDASAVASGMVFTIEPGAYLPGWGGVRIEDDVLVTEGGVEVLTDVPTALIET